MPRRVAQAQSTNKKGEGMRHIKYPKAFEKAVTKYGNPENIAPTGFGDNLSYTNVWRYDWLIERLYSQYRYAKAKAAGKECPHSWFWGEYDCTDWKETAMHVMNAHYSGNATYEWFEMKDGKIYKTNWYERIKDTSDPRLDNPALDYIFAHLDLTLTTALKQFKKGEECYSKIKEPVNS